MKRYRLSVILSILTIGLSSCLAAADSSRRRFDLGDGEAKAGYKAVPSWVVYNDKHSYGFDGGNRIYTFDGTGLHDGWTADGPFHFAVEVPEGNYRVRVLLGCPDRVTQTAIKSEQRRYMIVPQHLSAGESRWVTFGANVRTPALPDGGSVRILDREQGTAAWDPKLNIEFLGHTPAVAAIEIMPDPDVVTVYLAGDSTVVDGREEPWSGWGQMLPVFFKPEVIISNHAESGRSVRSFTAERRFEKIMTTLKQGDYVFMQFGHNDMKEKGEGIGPYLSFQDGLRAFITSVRDRGATPVLVTPMHRRRFNEDGTIRQTFGDYPEAIRQVATERDVSLIDLQASSRAFYESLGPERSKAAFVHYPAGTYPGQDKTFKDDTHHNNYGAYVLARCVVDGIRATGLPLADSLSDDIGDFDPANALLPEDLDVPPSYIGPGTE